MRPCESTIGGGSLPGDVLPSWALVYPHHAPQTIAQHLRMMNPAIIGRINDQALWLDLRSVLPEYDDTLIKYMQHIHGL